MDRIKDTSRLNLTRAATGLVFLSLFALPWINAIHLSTFLFLGLGVVLVGGKRFSAFQKPRFSWIFILPAFYYMLQIGAFCFFPHDKGNIAAISQKASLIVIPVLFYFAAAQYSDTWKWAIRGLIWGVIFALACCLIFALFSWFGSHNPDVFFYHAYAKITGLNAIYLSLYILVALVYVVMDKEDMIYSGRKSQWLTLSIVGFFVLNLILLSSKMMIVTGAILLVLFIPRLLRNKAGEIFAYIALALAGIGLMLINNPVSKRYRDIDWQNYKSVFRLNDFTNYSFDGLNLRLLLWRMGGELTKYNFGWLTGLGGEHYHTAMNEKIKQYHLYTGDATGQDTGYLNYNMHNQYMESFVQFGVTGSLALIAALLFLLYSSFHYHNDVLKYLVFIFIAIFASESVLETQAGILLFTITAGGEWIRLQQKKLIHTI
jgi:O-antigen ligase